MGFGTWMKEQRELALAKKADQDAVKAAVKTRVDAASREAEIATKVAHEVAKWQQRNAALDAQFEKNKAKFEAEQAAKAARELAKRRKVEIREYNNAKDFE